MNVSTKYYPDPERPPKEPPQKLIECLPMTWKILIVLIREIYLLLLDCFTKKRKYDSKLSQVKDISQYPVKNIIKKCTAGYKLSKLQENISHLMYMDDIKRFVKTEKKLETLIQAVRIYSHGTGMELGIEKFTILIMKSGKRHMTERIIIIIIISCH